MLLFSLVEVFAADIKKPGARGTGTGKARHSPEKPGGRRMRSGLAKHLKRRGFRCEKRRGCE
jgi:hypothetical protein